MTDWIKINLPWSVQPKDETPEYPDLTDKMPPDIRAIEEKVRAIDDADYDDSLYCQYRKVELQISLEEEKKLELEGVVEDSFNTELDKRVKAKMDALHGPLVSQMDELLKNKKIVKEWVDQQPEMEAWIKECERIHDIYRQKRAEGSFEGKGLNKPGVLVEVIMDNEPKQYLIGHINPNRGVCDDCTRFDSDVIVKRYRVIWEPEKTTEGS